MRGAAFELQRFRPEELAVPIFTARATLWLGRYRGDAHIAIIAKKARAKIRALSANGRKRRGGETSGILVRLAASTAIGVA